jgi:hypothetical protein
MTLSITGQENGIYKSRHYCIFCLADIIDNLEQTYRTPDLKVVEVVEKENKKEES